MISHQNVLSFQSNQLAEVVKSRNWKHY